MVSNIPPELIRSLAKQDHFNAETFLAVHDSGEQLVSVHMNPEKPIFPFVNGLENNSEVSFAIAGRVPWAPDAWYLSSRPIFTLDPLFHAGSYYVQEPSGMFLAFAMKKIIDLSKKINVLDLCAAPGGKSTLIQSLISHESLLVSNEVIRNRVPVLYQNMTKWGGANGIVCNNDPAHFKKLQRFFDILLIDAPCSGSGLFRKNPEAFAVWSPDLVNLCSLRQKRIVADAWHSLKEGGFLVYSTCSYSKEENEDILDEIFKQYPGVSIPLSPDPSWNIVETNSEIAGAFGYRFYPDKLSGEGFFLAVIQKKQNSGFFGLTDPYSQLAKPGKNASGISKAIEKQIKIFMKEDLLQYLCVEDSVHALPSALVNDFEILKNHLYLKKAGIRLGKSGENGWIPDHELALANFLNADTPSIEVSKSDAVRYLRGETFETEMKERGWKTVNFLGSRLGWVKILDKRMNNYYPKSWRIRQ